MIEEHDIVQLRHDNADCGVSTDCIGVVQHIPAPGVYVVEFFDANGETIDDALSTPFYEDALIQIDLTKESI